MESVTPVAGFIVCKVIEESRSEYNGVSLGYNKHTNSKKAQIISMGKEDGRCPYDENLKEGAHILMPIQGKQKLDNFSDQDEYYVIHHTDIRIVYNKEE